MAAVACGGAVDGGIDDPLKPSDIADAAVKGDARVETDASKLKDAAVVDTSIWPADASMKDVQTVDVVVDYDAGCVQNPAPPPTSDGSFTCTWDVPLPCAVPLDGGYVTQQQCQQYCGSSAFSCYPTDLNALGGGGGGDGYTPNWVLECVSCAVGRRPEGYAPSANDATAPLVGQFFASVAELEAASVFSFERLERELEALGAPLALRKRARRAASDERRHARVTSALASRFGGAPRAATGAPEGVRDLEAIAIENAVEGCVRETFGALTATIQAERAGDARVRAAMRRIAADETAHASLAWSVASWAATQLDAAAQARVRAAIEDAIEGLAREACVEPPAELRTIAGLPSGREAAALIDGMREMLWAA